LISYFDLNPHFDINPYTQNLGFGDLPRLGTNRFEKFSVDEKRRLVINISLLFGSKKVDYRVNNGRYTLEILVVHNAVPATTASGVPISLHNPPSFRAWTEI